LSTETDVDNNYIDKELEFRNNYFNNWKTINPLTKIITAPKTGYFIQMEEPTLVVNEINEMISKLNK
jgi:hypothetical protein